MSHPNRYWQARDRRVIKLDADSPLLDERLSSVPTAGIRPCV